jgi:hypothetical protein
MTTNLLTEHPPARGGYIERPFGPRRETEIQFFATGFQQDAETRHLARIFP